MSEMVKMRVGVTELKKWEIEKDVAMANDSVFVREILKELCSLAKKMDFATAKVKET